jgi:hypothetical protein
MVEYRTIADFPGYRVGDDGSLWSIFGVRGKLVPWHQLRARTKRNGYFRIVLHINKKPIGIDVHRFVLRAFRGECPDGMEACHGNGNREDNRLVNLRWDTPHNNAVDQLQHGTRPRGSRSGRSKLTEQIVTEIRELAASGIRQGEVADRYQVCEGTVSMIVNRRIWRHCQ